MNTKHYLKTLSLIHAALCAGLILFALFAYWNVGGVAINSAQGDLFVYIVPVGAMIGYFTSKYLFQKFIGKLPNEAPLESKLTRYQSALLVKYAALEIPALLALVAYLQKGTALYGVIAIALMLYLLAQRPTKDKLLAEVPLNFEEKKQFDTLSS